MLMPLKRFTKFRCLVRTQLKLGVNEKETDAKFFSDALLGGGRNRSWV
jgi:hypothetical protein